MASAWSRKKKHIFLSTESKLQILSKLSEGESGTSLAKMYGAGTSTISDIKMKKDIMLQYASKLNSEDGSKTRKTLRMANNTALKDAMFICFTQRRTLGEPISGPLVCGKALEFNDKLGGPPDFKASS